MDRASGSVVDLLGELASRARASDDEIAAYDRERERDLKLARLRDSGVRAVLPEAMVTAVTHGRLEPNDSLDVVRGWWGSQRIRNGRYPVLALLGAMGRGKTVSAAWLLAREDGLYVEAEELVRLHAANWGEERERFQRLLRAGTLVVDELGTEGDSRAALRNVINHRLGRKLTLLLGNLSKPDLKERLDPRTWDRLRTCTAVVEVHGDSMRKGDL